MDNEKLNHAFARVLKEWINQEQPEAIEIPYLAGKHRSELEKDFSAHYIVHDEKRGNLELTHENGIISCLMENDICVKAYFIGDE